MARPLRVEFEGVLYHLTAGGTFATEADRERFLWEEIVLWERIV
jgi:hypothetical protein